MARTPNDLDYAPSATVRTEPLSAAPADSRTSEELRRILKQTGMTGLYVTHDQAEAVVLGDRIGVMREGKLLQMAPPSEIYNRPADPFVANFTGASNVLVGKVLARSGDTDAAEQAYERAIGLEADPAVREFLQRRLAQLRGRSGTRRAPRASHFSA